MQKSKRILCLVTCLALMLTLVGVSAFAESSKTNMNVSVSPVKAEMGNRITVTISNLSMKVSSFTGGIEFDTDMLECVSITEGSTEVDVISTVDEAASAGTVGFAIIGFKDVQFAAGTLATVTFTAKKTGKTAVTLYEDSAGEDGYKSDNADTKMIEIAAKSEKHDLSKVAAKDATCTEKGYSEYWKCSDCGKLFRDAEGKNEISEPETIPALGHTLMKSEAKVPTCTADGTREYYTCSVCNKLFADRDGKNEITKDDTVVKATGHNWGEWVVTKEATVTEKGSESRTCKNDSNHKETREIPVVGHVHELEAVEAKEATCTKDGNIQYWQCALCDRLFADENGEKELNEEDVIVEATGHEWSEWVVTKEATKTETGLETRTCKKDVNHKETREIPVVGTEITVTPEVSEGGSISPAKVICEAGDQQEFTVTPKEGYEIAGVTVDGKNIDLKDNKFTVENLNSATVIKVEFRKKAVDPETEDVNYTDVKEGSWYYNAAYYATEKGYMIGIGNNRFGPNNIVTRGTIVQILFAMEGKPAGAKNAGFNDVVSGKWYYDAINWAAGHGIVAGYSSQKFGPEDPVTRQQMVAILYKYAKYKNYDTTSHGILSRYKDSNTISSYAVIPMKWAIQHEIISGTGKGLEPTLTATRAQIAVILQAFDKNVK